MKGTLKLESICLVPGTRGQQIRASDDALARWLIETGHDDNLGFCKDLPECMEAYECGETPDEEKCLKCLVEWLGKKIEGEQENDQ